MTFKATLDDSTATISVTGMNVAASIKISNAADLSDQLVAFVNDPAAAPIDNSPAYMAYPSDTGVRLVNQQGEIDIPWRWLLPISAALKS